MVGNCEVTFVVHCCKRRILLECSVNVANEAAVDMQYS